MKKAIFGGTFDPIHKGHIYIAYQALKYLNLDKVIFMPSGNPPHKSEKKITDGFLRSKMISMSIENEERFEVSNYEINKSEISYTYKTLEHFRQLEPNTEWYFLTGTDCLMEIDSWKSVDRIFNVCNFVVFSRGGYNHQDIINKKKEVEETYKSEIIYLDIRVIDVSSTQVRKMISNDLKVNDYLPLNVYNTIKELGLYK